MINKLPGAGGLVQIKIELYFILIIKTNFYIQRIRKESYLVGGKCPLPLGIITNITVYCTDHNIY